MKKIIFILMIVMTLILTSCIDGSKNPLMVNLPDDLYDCQTDDDCALVNKNIIENECCMWDAINVQYKDWYQETANKKVKCWHSCPMSYLKTEAVCFENKCLVRETRFEELENLG